MISKEDIEQLAQLSRLVLTAQESTQLQEEFQSILDYVAHIGSIATSEESLAAGSLMHNSMREDTIGTTPGGEPQELLDAAPQREGDYIVVRKIISKDE